MRSSKSRSRSKANRPRSIGNIINRVFDSSGPEGKVRGTPQQIIEKYLILARDAQLSNDRVAAENFLQHAEHYTRLLGEAQRELAAEQEERQRQYQQNGNQGRDGQPRDRGDRPDYRPDFRNDRPDYRAEPRDPGAGDQPDIAAVALVAPEAEPESMLVDTPEMKPREQPRREGENRVKTDRREHRDRREPREPREPRPARAGGEHAAVHPARDAAPAEPVVDAPAAAPVDAPADTAAKPDTKPRKPAAPRKPRPKADKPQGDAGPADGANDKAQAAE